MSDAENFQPEDQDPQPLQSAESDPLPPAPMESGASEKDNMIADLQAELGKAKDQTLRALAEAENTRRRGQKEREDATKYAVTAFARDLLDFSDNVRRAIDAIPDDLKNAGDERIKNLIAGLAAMEQQMLRTFEKHGIKKLSPLNEPFDPHFHEVIFEAPGTGKPPGMIIQVAEPGYILHGRLLRPARVGVAKDEGQGGGSGSRIDTEV